MEWNGRIVMLFVTAFVVVTAVVVLAILRLGGIIAWPARWVVFVLFALLIAPVVMVFFAVAAQAEEQSEDGGVMSWISNISLWPW